VEVLEEVEMEVAAELEAIEILMHQKHQEETLVQKQLKH
jgi:hypothetical protein